MSAVIALFTILGLSIGLASWFKWKIAEAIPFAIFGIVLVLYVFGLANQMLLGLAVIYALSLAAIFLAIWSSKKKSDFALFKQLNAPWFGFFLGFSILSFALSRSRYFAIWDEFSHWGTVVKAMYEQNSLSPFNSADLLFRSYPPSASIFEYFVARGSAEFSEGDVIWALQLLAISFTVAFLANSTWKRVIPALIAGSLALVVQTVFVPNPFLSVYVDSLLGITFGFLAAWIILKPQFGLLPTFTLCLGLFFLALLKDSGLFFAAIVFLMHVTKVLLSRRANENFKFRVFALQVTALVLTLVTAYASWSLTLSLQKVTKMFGQTVDFLAPWNSSAPVAPSHWKETVVNFLFGLSNYTLSPGVAILRLPALAWLIVSALALMGIVILSKSRTERWAFKSENFFSFLVLALGSMFYMYGLLVMYLSRFSSGEAVALASYERYAGTYFLGFAFAITLVLGYWIVNFKQGEFSSEAKIRSRYKVVLFVAWSLLILLVTDFSAARDNVVASKADRQTLAQLASNTRNAGAKPGDKVWILSQRSNGFAYWIERYELLDMSTDSASWSVGKKLSADDAWTDSKITLKTWPDALKSFDYLVLINSDDAFRSEFGSLFEDPSNITDLSIYKIEPSGEGIRFVKK